MQSKEPQEPRNGILRQSIDADGIGHRTHIPTSQNGTELVLEVHIRTSAPDPWKVAKKMAREIYLQSDVRNTRVLLTKGSAMGGRWVLPNEEPAYPLGELDAEVDSETIT